LPTRDLLGTIDRVKPNFLWTKKKKVVCKTPLKGLLNRRVFQGQGHVMMGPIESVNLKTQLEAMAQPGDPDIGNSIFTRVFKKKLNGCQW
jgi:hypothetical protein